MHRLYYLSIVLVSVTVALADNDLLPKPGECGKILPEQHFKRTNIAQPNEFPWLAKVLNLNSNTNEFKLKCLAVLINERYLITMSFCKQDVVTHVELGYAEDSFFCGATGNCSTKKVLEIEEIIQYPYFEKRNAKNDIALLRLNSTVTFTDYIRPICLPNIDVVHKQFSGTQLMLAGFGMRTRSDEKLKMFVLVHNLVDCQRNFLIHLNITEAHICGITCENEMMFLGGSTLMEYELSDNQKPDHYYLVGLLSFGPVNCGYPAIPSAFTRVDRYLSWIKENIY